MRIALYGGSFDPPHLGHLEAARTVMRELGPDKLLIIPANLPPHKALPAGSPSAEQRLCMCRMTFESVRGAEVSDLELRRPGRSYTADTVRQLLELYPGDRFILVVGTDMLLSFEHWNEFKFLLGSCALTAFPRENGERAELEECAARLREMYSADVTVLDHAPRPMSSSNIRAALPRRQGAQLLEGRTYETIVREGWYGALPELDWLRQRARELLTPKRARHTDGCESAAAALARRWGADEDTAAEAAILHDITKKLSAEEQLHLCAKYDKLCADTMRDYPQLLHAVTGAGYAKERFGVSDEVADAIRWHTTGRPNMTALEKIVYLADVTEPGRDFPGVDRLRELSFRDLDAAMALALEMSVENLRGRCQDVFPDTLAARDWYKSYKE